jgi:hypothetical protein
MESMNEATPPKLTETQTIHWERQLAAAERAVLVAKRVLGLLNVEPPDGA